MEWTTTLRRTMNGFQCTNHSFLLSHIKLLVLYDIFIVKVALVPDTPSPMMRYFVLPSNFPFLHRIIKKEINQDSIYFCLGVPSEDLSTD